MNPTLIRSFAKRSISRPEAISLLKEGSRLFSYLLKRVKSLPLNYTIYYLTLNERIKTSGLLDGGQQPGRRAPPAAGPGQRAEAAVAGPEGTSGRAGPEVSSGGRGAAAGPGRAVPVGSRGRTGPEGSCSSGAEGEVSLGLWERQ